MQIKKKSPFKGANYTFLELVDKIQQTLSVAFGMFSNLHSGFVWVIKIINLMTWAIFLAVWINLYKTVAESKIK